MGVRGVRWVRQAFGSSWPLDFAYLRISCSLLEGRLCYVLVSTYISDLIRGFGNFFGFFVGLGLVSWGCAGSYNACLD